MSGGPISQSAPFLHGAPYRVSREWWLWLSQVGSITGVNLPPLAGTTTIVDVQTVQYLSLDNGDLPDRHSTEAKVFAAAGAPQVDAMRNFLDGRLVLPQEPSKTLDARVLLRPEGDSNEQRNAQLCEALRVDEPPPGSWVTYTSTVTAGSGAFTTASAAGRYQIVGKRVMVAIEIDVTTMGTAAASVLATLPVASSKALTSGFQALSGVEFGSTNKALTCLIGSPDTSHMRILFYDGTFPGASGSKLIVQGSYEAA